MSFIYVLTYVYKAISLQKNTNIHYKLQINDHSYFVLNNIQIILFTIFFLEKIFSRIISRKWNVSEYS